LKDAFVLHRLQLLGGRRESDQDFPKEKQFLFQNSTVKLTTLELGFFHSKSSLYESKCKLCFAKCHFSNGQSSSSALNSKHEPGQLSLINIQNSPEARQIEVSCGNNHSVISRYISDLQLHNDEGSAVSQSFYNTKSKLFAVPENAEIIGIYGDFDNIWVTRMGLLLRKIEQF